MLLTDTLKFDSDKIYVIKLFCQTLEESNYSRNDFEDGTIEHYNSIGENKYKFCAFF